jgi:hypothetical protein
MCDPEPRANKVSPAADGAPAPVRTGNRETLGKGKEF